MILRTKKEVEQYIEDLKFDTDLRRLQEDRYVSIKPQAEMCLSDSYSNKLGLKKGTFDNSMIELKKKVILESIEKYPYGVKINKVGGVMPILSVTELIKYKEEESEC